MNAESSRLRSTWKTSSDMSAIWPGALVVVYLAVTGLLLLIGRSHGQPGGLALHFGVLAAMAAATWLKTTPRWLQLWAPLLVLLFLYTEMPMLIRAAGHDTFFDASVIRWERAMFSGQPAIEWAGRWPFRALSELLHAAYLSYYFIIFSVPAALYLRGRREEFSEALLVLMLTFITCFASYIAMPVSGPRYVWESPASAIGGRIRELAIWLLDARSSQGTAFPSSHVAVAVAQSILAVRYLGRRGLVIAVLSSALALGAIYGGFHYAVDVVYGALLGAATTVLGLTAAKQLRRVQPSQANATAPT